MAYSSILKPSDYFETTTYTGGATDVSSLSFQPDFVWAKKRDGTENHGLFDAVRGATKTLNSNTNSAESTRSGSLTSFDSDGWSMGGSDGIISASGSTYVGWGWKANGQGSANTDGSINTTYTSANTTSGFSISKYTGTGSEATVGHGLGVTPKIVFFKRLDSSANWVVQTPLLGNRVQLVLNDTSAENTDSRLGASDNWSNSVFTVGTYGDMNGSGGTYIAYCFAEKKGYSKFGSYTGDGNTNGPFIYTGFKPAFVLIKSSSDTGNWHLADNKRIGFNPWNYRIQPSDSNAEYQGSAIYSDFLSNGFNLRNSDTDSNGSGRTYLYMAIAEEPLVANSGTDGVPATAR